MTIRITAAPPTSAIPVFVHLLVFVLQMHTQQQQQQQLQQIWSLHTHESAD